MYTPPFQTHSISNTPILLHIIHTYPFYSTLYTLQLQTLDFKHSISHTRFRTLYIPYTPFSFHIIHTYAFDFTLYTLPFQPLYFKHTQTHPNRLYFKHTCFVSYSYIHILIYTYIYAYKDIHTGAYNTHISILFYSVHSTISTTSFQTHTNTLYFKHTCFLSYSCHIS